MSTAARFRPPVARSLVACLVAAVCLALPAFRSLASPEADLAAFDQVWETVRDRHPDPALGGVDWEKARQELRPRVAAAASTEEARRVLRELLGRLGESHFAIIAGSARPAGAPGGEEGERGEGTAGLAVRVLDGAAIVTEVDDRLAGAREGVKPGWEVVRVGTTAIAPYLQTLRVEVGESSSSACLIAKSVETLLTGDPGEGIEVAFRAEEGRPEVRRLTFAVPPGRAAGIGFLAPMPIDFRARRLSSEIGYISFKVFLDPSYLMREFGETLRSLSASPGLVLDLRGNPGGLAVMAMGMGGWLVPERHQKLGTMRTRETTLEFVLSPRPNPFTRPLAILVDACTMSTAEILASGLQDLGRARLFGTLTGGAALPSSLERLPNGDLFQYAFASYVSASGRRLEGQGVLPDSVIEPDRAALLAGKDMALEAAVEWILSPPPAPAPPVESSPSPPAASCGIIREMKGPFATAAPARRLASRAAGMVLLAMLPLASSPGAAEEATLSSAPPAVAAPALPAGEEILERYIKVTGGRKAYAKIRTRRARGTIGIPALGLEGRFEILQAAQDLALLTIDLPGLGAMTQGHDGKIVWEQSDILGPRILEGTERETALWSGALNAEVHWRDYFSGASCEGIETVDGSPAYRVVLAASDGGDLTLFFEKESGLLVMSSMDVPTPMGEIPGESRPSDYRRVDGILIPHTIKESTMGQEMVTRIDSIEHNVEIPRERFATPAEVLELTRPAAEGSAPSR